MTVSEAVKLIVDRNPSAVKHEKLNMGRKIDGIRTCPTCAPTRKPRRKKALGPAGQLTLEGIARSFAGEAGVEYLRGRK